ncbi:hydrogenase accessory protein HypB [Thermoplasmatales archaeon BRNA1]|nr:hydrogenase accessory protein HypB [Thermoplasmatales archaeon BRNA1]
MEHDVLRANDKLAHENYHMFKTNGVKTVDFMGSIGSGKTTLIIELGKRLVAQGKKVCVIAGDVTGDDDFKRFKAGGLDAINCNTGKECHLEARDIQRVTRDVDLSRYDIVFIENVGNLVCPADFNLGTDFRVAVISTTEGDDMVRKHHAIFQHSDMAILNKIDIADAVGVDPQIILDDYKKLTGELKPMITTAAKKGDGVDEVLRFFGF